MPSVHLTQTAEQAAHGDETLPQITGSRLEPVRPTAPSSAQSFAFEMNSHVSESRK